MLKAIVFDFDGVIVDSEPLHYQALLQLSRTIGYEFDYAQYLERYLGYDDRGAFEAILIDAGKYQQSKDRALIASLVAKKKDAFEAVVSGGVQSYPGMIEFIRTAAARVPVAIASGATTYDIELCLKGLGLRDLFPIIVSADWVEQSKPDPATYRLAVQELAKANASMGIKPEDCLAIEDTAAGIDSARGAGLWTLGVTNSCDAATLARAHRVVPRVGDVTLEQLQQWFA
jgi:beta-phosphoglucomutase